MKNIIVLSIIFIAVTIFSSCEQLNVPTGNISAVDLTPPEAQIIYPIQNSTVKGMVTFKIILKDYFSKPGFILRNEAGNQIWASTLRYDVDTVYYDVDMGQWQGKKSFYVHASDQNENLNVKKIDLNIIPTIKHVFVTATTNSIKVNSIKSDNKGNVWLALEQGLLKYDGDTLLKSVTGFDLPSPAIRTLAIDKHDVLWMNYYERNTGGNNPRLIGFDGNQVIKNIVAPHTTSNLLYNSFAVDYNDTLFGSGIDHYFKFNGDGWETFSEGGDKYFYYMTNDKNFNVWMRATNGIRKYSQNGWISYAPPFPIAYNYFVADDFSNIWILRTDINDVILKFDGTNWNSINLQSSSGTLRSFDVDKDGNLWVSSDHGLYKYDNNGVFIKKVSSLSNEFLIKADQYNNIWIVSDFGIYLLNENGFE